jgi:hypothetical protein
MYAALHMSYLNEASLQALSRLAVIIPAWQPEPQLIALAEDLVTQGFGAVIVLNDGRELQHLPLFEAVGQLPGVRVLTPNRARECRPQVTVGLPDGLWSGLKPPYSET